jgi:hypothetical protein
MDGRRGNIEEMSAGQAKQELVEELNIIASLRKN